jgi:hypothetical protein
MPVSARRSRNIYVHKHEHTASDADVEAKVLATLQGLQRLGVRANLPPVIDVEPDRNDCLEQIVWQVIGQPRNRAEGLRPPAARGAAGPLHPLHHPRSEGFRYRTSTLAMGRVARYRDRAAVRR